MWRVEFSFFIKKIIELIIILNVFSKIINYKYVQIIKKKNFTK